MWTGDRTLPRPGPLIGAVVLAAFALLAIAGRARADQVYWANTNVISYSQLDDTAGGYLPASFGGIHGGEGTAIDTANGRIYVSQKATDKIVWYTMGGLTSGVVNTAGASIDHPTNLSIDPRTQTLYWANDVSPGSISYARVNESGGGNLAQPGWTPAHVAQPSRIAVDMLHERIYWWNEGTQDFAWVSMNGLVGNNLTTPGITIGAEKMGGIAIEPYSVPEELYFMNNTAHHIFHTDPLLGGEPEEVQGAVAEKEGNAKEATGLAFDGTHNQFYWANRGADEELDMAIGTATLFGHPGTLRVFPVAPIHSPVFAAILKEPVPLGAPQVSLTDTTMTCTLGEWEGDHPGGSVYAAPTTYGYQWFKSSVAIPGANAGSYTATESGSYVCAVTAANAAGELVGKSKATTITFPAKPKAPTTPTTTTKATTTTKPKTAAVTLGAKLASTKPVKVTAGGSALIKVDLTNSEKTTSGSTKVCGTLTKKAKKGLKTPACVTVNSVGAGKTVAAGLTVKTLASARGTYKLTVALTGASTASLNAKVQVTAPKGK